MLSGMTTAPAEVLDPGWVTVEEIPVQDLMVIRADITIKIIRITRVVTTSSSNSRVTRATQSS